MNHHHSFLMESVLVLVPVSLQQPLRAQAVE
jgi:hypothetical protein